MIGVFWPISADLRISSKDHDYWLPTYLPLALTIRTLHYKNAGRERGVRGQFLEFNLLLVQVLPVQYGFLIENQGCFVFNTVLELHEHVNVHRMVR